MRKKAQGHVEIVLSMVLFIGFLFFVFFYLNPAFRAKPDLPIGDIQQTVINEISADIGKLSVIVAAKELDEEDSNCYYLSNEIIEKYGNDWMEIPTPGQPRSYTIYYGNFFANKRQTICSTEKERADWDFTLGVYTEESIVRVQKIRDLVTEYNENYKNLKERLDVRDFSFVVKNLDGQPFLPEAKERIPANVDILVKDIPIRVINNQGQFSELILSIKTWR